MDCIITESHSCHGMTIIYLAAAT